MKRCEDCGKSLEAHVIKVGKVNAPYRGPNWTVARPISRRILSRWAQRWVAVYCDEESPSGRRPTSPSFTRSDVRDLIVSLLYFEAAT